MLVIEALRTPRSMSEMYVQCRPDASASCSCVSPALCLSCLILRPRGFRGSVTLVTTPRYFPLYRPEYIAYRLYHQIGNFLEEDENARNGQGMEKLGGNDIGSGRNCDDRSGSIPPSNRGWEWRRGFNESTS